MKRKGKLFAAALIALMIVAAGLVQAFNLVAGRHREQVRQELGKILGQDLSFDSLEVTLFFTPGFSIKEFRVADDSRFAATPIIRAKEMVLGLSLWNLLWGRMVVNSLVFKEPELQIIIAEEGSLNLALLSNRKKELHTFPKLSSPAAPGRKVNPIGFSIEKLSVKNGQIEYLDRSVTAPAELQAKNIDMVVKGFGLTDATTIGFAASLTEGLSQDVRINGEIAADKDDAPWWQRKIDMDIRFDSLRVPVIARAVASLRDRIPRELDVTGALSLQAKASGTIARPRFENIVVQAPLFGASDYNAVATGFIDFSAPQTSAAAELQGKLSIRSIDFERLRQLPLLRQYLSPTVSVDGKVSLFSRFEGGWETLRAGALIVADKGEIRFREWLRKPAKDPAEIRLRLSRQQQNLLIHESELLIGTNRMGFSGRVESEPAPRLRLTLQGEQSAAAGWSRLLSAAAFNVTAGQADWRIDIDKSLAAANEDWQVHGKFKLADAELKHNLNGRKLAGVNADVSFAGKRARLDRLTFSAGTSAFSVIGQAANLLEPRLDYQMRATQMNLAELPAPAESPPLTLMDVNGKGRILVENGQTLLTGAFAAATGRYQQFNFRDFRADVEWSAAGLAFSNLSLQLFNGALRSRGTWSSSGESARQLRGASQADALELSALVAHWIPSMKDRLAGRLSGKAQFDATHEPGKAERDSVKISGETAIERGAIKDFNLASQLLLRGSGASTEASSRLPAGFTTLLSRRDTMFDVIKANYWVEGQRFRSDNLIISTPDYTITGAGWIDFDGSTRWNGLLILSPRLSQDVQRDYRLIRYLLDRRGRLSIAFRLDGTIPNVRIRLENRLLAQALRAGAPQSGGTDERPPSEENGGTKNWLPDALDRLINK